MKTPQLSLRRSLSTTLSVFLAAGLGLIGPAGALAEGVERGGLNFTIVSDEISGTAHGSVPEVQATSTSPDTGGGSGQTSDGSTGDSGDGSTGTTSGDTTSGSTDGTTGGDTTSGSTDGTSEGDATSGSTDGTTGGDTTASTDVDTSGSGTTETVDSGSTTNYESGSTSAELNAKGKANSANGKKKGQR